MNSTSISTAASRGPVSRGRIWRGKILHALSASELVFLPDGALVIDDQGLILACDHWDTLARDNKLPETLPCTTLPDHMLLMPGMVDTHVHLPQLAATGCQEDDLLSWLNNHIFAEESRFAAPDYAQTMSQWFFQALLRNGTTTANVFLTSHPEASRIAFEVALSSGNRVIMGQNLMDCHAPANLIRDTQMTLEETERLCRQWHQADHGRIQYAWVPRFALTSTELLLEGLGRLRRAYPDVYLHTHLSEQQSEVSAVQAQFPWADSYTHVYERFGLLGSRTILAHAIHLSNEELQCVQHHDCALAHCPGSNFFLKSGRFRWLDALAMQIRFGLGSDVGAGPELSMFKAMKDAQYMQGHFLIPVEQLFYRATLGGAQALCLDDRIGNFLPGKEADFLLLDCQAKSEFSHPHGASLTTHPETDHIQLLSRLIYLGDDRLVRATFVRGELCFGMLPDQASPLAV